VGPPAFTSIRNVSGRFVSAGTLRFGSSTMNLTIQQAGAQPGKTRCGDAEGKCASGRYRERRRSQGSLSRVSPKAQAQDCPGLLRINHQYIYFKIIEAVLPKQPLAQRCPQSVSSGLTEPGLALPYQSSKLFTNRSPCNAMARLCPPRRITSRTCKTSGSPSP